MRAATTAWQIKKAMKAMNKDLDIDVIPEAVDDVVHLGAPVVAPGLELFVLLRSARAMNEQTRDCSAHKSQHGANFFAVVLRS
jgi:hypothetical protein